MELWLFSKFSLSVLKEVVERSIENMDTDIRV